MINKKGDNPLFSSFLILFMLSLSLSLIFISCEVKEEELTIEGDITLSPSDNNSLSVASFTHDCDTTIMSDIDSSTFVGLLGNGTPNNLYVVCIEPGVTVNSAASTPINLTHTNINIISRGDNPAVINYIKLNPLADGKVRFENIKIRDNVGHNDYAIQTAAEGTFEFHKVDAYASGSADVLQDENDSGSAYGVNVIITDSTFKQAGTGGNAINSYNDRWQEFNLTIDNSYLETLNEDVIFLDGSGGVVKINGSTIKGLADSCSWCGSGFYAIDLSSITITNNTFWVKESSAFQYNSKSNVGRAATIVVTGNTIHSEYKYGVLRFGPANTVTFSNNKISKGTNGANTYYAVEVLNPSTHGKATINGSGNTYCNVDPSLASFTSVVSNTYEWDGNWSPVDISSKPTCQ